MCLFKYDHLDSLPANFPKVSDFTVLNAVSYESVYFLFAWSTLNKQNVSEYMKIIF